MEQLVADMCTEWLKTKLEKWRKTRGDSRDLDIDKIQCDVAFIVHKDGRCIGTTQLGKKCRHMAIKSSMKCQAHQDTSIKTLSELFMVSSDKDFKYSSEYDTMTYGTFMGKACFISSCQTMIFDTELKLVATRGDDGWLLE